jgi:hypothetical protein
LVNIVSHAKKFTQVINYCTITNFENHNNKLVFCKNEKKIGDFMSSSDWRHFYVLLFWWTAIDFPIAKATDKKVIYANVRFAVKGNKRKRSLNNKTINLNNAGKYWNGLKGCK